MHTLKQWFGPRGPLKFTSPAAWRAGLLPAMGILVFLCLWQVLASQIVTSLGELPGPVATAKQLGSLYQEYQGERDKREAFYARQAERNAVKLKADPKAEVKVRPYTGRPTFFDQVLTSLITVASGFLVAVAIAIPAGIVLGLSRNLYAAINPLVQILKPISPLAWLTVYQNVELAVQQVRKGASKADIAAKVRYYLSLVQMDHALDKKPHEISGGMKQRVGIARALSMSPKVLLMDEPFGALDALTRAHLQDALMEIQAELNNTVIMITHDVDEAVLLSDRIVMMTNGPAATVGEILDITLPRPRNRVALADDPEYHKLRQSVLSFLYEKHSKVTPLKKPQAENKVAVA